MSDRRKDPATEAVIAICKIMAALPEVHRSRAEAALHALTAPEPQAAEGRIADGMVRAGAEALHRARYAEHVAREGVLRDLAALDAPNLYRAMWAGLAAGMWTSEQSDAMRSAVALIESAKRAIGEGA